MLMLIIGFYWLYSSVSGCLFVSWLGWVLAQVANPPFLALLEWEFWAKLWDGTGVPVSFFCGLASLGGFSDTCERGVRHYNKTCDVDHRSLSFDADSVQPIDSCESQKVTTTAQ